MSVLEASIERAQNGDRTAFDELVRNYQQRAIYAAYSRLRDLQLAEDIVQEALMEAHERISQLRFPEAFPLWLSRIVRTKARKVGQKHPRTTSIESCPVADPGYTAEQMLERELIRRGVHHSLIQLAEHQRGVVRLYYFQDLRQLDICDASICPSPQLLNGFITPAPR